MASHRLEIKAGHGIHQTEHQLKKKKVLLLFFKDEFHFVLECSLYQELRQEYIKRFFWIRPNIPKFIELLQSENKNIIKNLSVYIYKSFEKRTEFLTR